MKQAFWPLLALFAATATAQQSDFATVRNQLALPSAQVANVAAVDGAQTGTASPATKPTTKQKAKAKDTTATAIKWPTVESSMVGYIDNAIVGNEIRVRFDAVFNDQFPDRAEFIYGKCGCYATLLKPGDAGYDPKAPGPKLGIPNVVNFQALSFMGE